MGYRSKDIDGGRSGQVFDMVKYKGKKCEECGRKINIKPYYSDMNKRFCKPCRKLFGV